MGSRRGPLLRLSSERSAVGKRCALRGPVELAHREPLPKRGGNESTRERESSDLEPEQSLEASSFTNVISRSQTLQSESIGSNEGGN